ncbi:MAG TPA: hypothetical protein VGO85_07260 [Caldimonas sp.]|nr:hypothetical protein [Caldimonas sp.]
MKPTDIDRVFGRGRLRMVTGDHVEVFREEALAGERRRYTKRFLATAAGDFSEWTEREWRILARLVGHGIKPVPDVVRFDRGASDRSALVQTYDAGVTVDHWATLLPLERDGTTLRNVFEDCAHWWALARHSLIALDAIHELHLVHLDLKADNVCIPVGPADFDPHARGQVLQPRFDDIALIDFAFSLVSGERLESALPIAQQADYEYQSPRLLRALAAGRHGDLAPTRQLDWRCDLFSLAAMLWRYLPELEDTTTGAWTRPRHARARALVRRLIEAHDAELPALRPHAELIGFAAEALAETELGASLQRGWTLAIDHRSAAALSPTPVTRIAMPVPITPITSAVVPPIVAMTTSRATGPITPAVLPPIMAAATSSATAPIVAAMASRMTAPMAAATSGLPAAIATAATLPAAPPRAATPDVVRSADRDSANEPLAVDPTDVALRIQARGRQRVQRARRLAWAGGLATAGVVATAAVAWLEPSWRSLPTARDLRATVTPARPSVPRRDEPLVALATTTPTPTPTAKAKATEHAEAKAAPAIVAPERVENGPTAAATIVAPEHVEANPAAASTIAAPAPVDAETPASKTTPPASSSLAVGTDATAGVDRPRAATNPAKAPAATGTKTPRDAAPTSPPHAFAAKPGSAEAARPRQLAGGRAVEPFPRSAAAARPAHVAMAFPAPGPRSAHGATTALAAARAHASAPSRVATAASRRSPAATPWRANGAPIPWAVAGRGAPRPTWAGAGTNGDRGALSVAAITPVSVAAPNAARSPMSSGAALANASGTAPAAGDTSAVAATAAAPTAFAVVAKPSLAADATAPVASNGVTANVAANTIAQTATTATTAPGATGDGAPVDYAARASELMSQHVPRLAQRAERLVARVLFIAGRSERVPGDDEIRAAAGSLGRDAGDALAGLAVSAREAERLGDAARAEYARRGGTAEALSLQARAFGANPLDVETAGNLAFLLLRQRPAQAEAARLLALHALTLHGARYPEGRIEDWATLAIASALSGRERDARNAFLVSLSLAPNLERQCKAALDVYALYGERLRAPVEAMLYSANASGRASGSSSCEWPPRWVVSGAAR